MAELFSEEWMNQLKDAWNNDPEIKDKLAEIKFNSVITCGYQSEEKPTSVFVVKNGECIHAGNWKDEESDWDMRADLSSWKKWMKKPLGLSAMGMAVATGKLKFNKGDYDNMIKNPSMAGPFIRSFSLMSQIG
ncbi:SCP2 sterol-binding domain-containing protein [Thiomicrorhabdus xiamenensis]|uniref:SCP2 sterol-binding domain-containing protein n=1 Tax=Thiomicrorhabdus xiamenensis TaxID=2739063 RepID=A0A7D4SP53_9GAMM|nr:SCP2 sterol-binding domain-containing protein [Thiomicrorhabdus xiamenensis]QKI90181.1 SCP2 sterol-binding domain-containing protein [Thiomicrorhabdus xiamenensis]